MGIVSGCPSPYNHRMSLFHAVVLSIVEGFTEFLPISSTAHLILAGKLFGIQSSPFTKSFDVFIQIGAILAVSLLYARRMLTSKTMMVRVVVAFVPTGVVGFGLYTLVKKFLLESSVIPLVMLLVGGFLLLFFEWWDKRRARFSPIPADRMTIPGAAFVGLFQSISVIPGVSRAAATIVGARLLGITREGAVEFSFLLAVPTVAAAAGLDLLKNSWQFTGDEWGLLGVGLVGSFVSALCAVRLFVSFVRTHSMIPFAWYRILLATVGLIYIFLRG